MEIADHYRELYARYGDDPRAVQWSDAATQQRRFQFLMEGLPDFRESSILEVGCGLGHLHSWLREQGFRGEYSGVDLLPEFVTACRQKLPGCRFEVGDIGAAPPVWEADYVVLSGVLNNPRPQPEAFAHTVLRNMYHAARRGIACNALSTYVDFRAGDLVYHHPEDLFRFCKEQLSPRVTLRHDYEVKPGIVPFEFTLHVYRSATPPRGRLD